MPPWAISSARPGRSHAHLACVRHLTSSTTFKHCPVAAAVYGQLSGESIHAEKVQFLVWTGTPPQRVPKSIWLFICISTVYAIDRGRRHMYKLQYHTEGPVPQTDTIVNKERPSPFRRSGTASISTPRKCLRAKPQSMPPSQL